MQVEVVGPIIFDLMSMKAIRELRINKIEKTVTRRLIWPKPYPGVVRFVDVSNPQDPRLAREWVGYDEKGRIIFRTRAPYAANTWVWVREPLRARESNGEKVAAYDVDRRFVFPNGVDGSEMYSWRWKRNYLPGRTMPRDAARSIARIASIKAERLIAIADYGLPEFLREGIDPLPGIEALDLYVQRWDETQVGDGRQEFATNPWVWRIEFLDHQDCLPLARGYAVAADWDPQLRQGAKDETKG